MKVLRKEEKRFKFMARIDYYIDENGAVIFEHIVEWKMGDHYKPVNSIAIHENKFKTQDEFIEWVNSKFKIYPKSVSLVFKAKER